LVHDAFFFHHRAAQARFRFGAALPFFSSASHVVSPRRTRAAV
jgi:hypothetical protein